MLLHKVLMLSFVSDLSGTLAAWKNSDLITGLLAAIFIVTLGIGIICLFLVIHFLGRGRLKGRGGLPDREFRRPGARPELTPFGSSCRWLAIHGSHPMALQEALQLHKATPCSWVHVLANLEEEKLFITPPVADWILVFGTALPNPAEDVDACYLLLRELSYKLGRVQFFSFNRTLNHHAWAEAWNGEITRAYAWAGQTVWNQGLLTRAEGDLRLHCYDYAETPPDYNPQSTNPLIFNTERVPLLAARWSIDPAAINARNLRGIQGILGELSWRKTS
jgi:hypothetical protein